MKVKDIIIRVARKAYRIITRRKFYAPECDCDRQSANDKIYNLLSSGKHLMKEAFLAYRTKNVGKNRCKPCK